ncbi:hypothetical protein NL676_032734 [Syzygium grande]|nr:hypothetical protein NL676_032734 [Syzygium grande]
MRVGLWTGIEYSDDGVRARGTTSASLELGPRCVGERSSEHVSFGGGGQKPLVSRPPALTLANEESCTERGFSEDMVTRGASRVALGPFFFRLPSLWVCGGGGGGGGGYGN